MSRPVRPQPPPEFVALLEQLPAEHRGVIREAWHSIAVYATEGVEGLFVLVHRMIRIISIALLLITLIVGGLGYLSVHLTIQQNRDRDRAVAAIKTANDQALRAVRKSSQQAFQAIQRSRRSVARQGCEDTNDRYHKAIDFINDLARKERPKATTPALKAELHQQQQQLNTLINDLTPLHKDCAARARNLADTSP